MKCIPGGASTVTALPPAARWERPTARLAGPALAGNNRAKSAAPLDEFAANGRLYWQALHDGDDRLSGEAQRAAQDGTPSWRPYLRNTVTTARCWPGPDVSSLTAHQPCPSQNPLAPPITAAPAAHAAGPRRCGIVVVGTTTMWHRRGSHRCRRRQRGASRRL